MAKKKSNGYGKGTFMDTEMLLSPAYLSLGKPGTGQTISSCSVHLLNSFLLKRRFDYLKDKKGGNRRWVRTDDNRFVTTYKELQSKPFKFSQPRITRAIDELLEKGFINIIDPGGEYVKHKAVYELVDDWKYWKPGGERLPNREKTPPDPPVRVRGRDVHRGYQGQLKGAVKKNPAHADVCEGHTRGRMQPNLENEGGHTRGRWSLISGGLSA